MKCTVYRSDKKQDTYLFVEQGSNFDRVPKSLIEILSPLVKVMELELTPERSLAQADAAEVIHQLEVRGYFVQLSHDVYRMRSN